MPFDAKDKFIILLSHTRPSKGDAIVFLAGDGENRIDRVVELFEQGYAPFVIVTSDANDAAYGSLPASVLSEKLKALGVPESAMIVEDSAAHTRAEADASLRIAKERGFRRLLFVTSPYHQYRAFLTLLKAVQDAGVEVEIINATDRNLSWFAENPWGKRIDLLDGEFERIDKYRALGHVASYEDGIAYLSSRIDEIPVISTEESDDDWRNLGNAV